MPSAFTSTVLHDAAESADVALHARLRDAGLRRTRALRDVLALFAQTPTWSPTHQQVAERLGEAGKAVNPVTLYRLLDRLVAAGVLARHTAAGERAWRFQWRDALAEGGTSHPHFECDQCHSHFLLADADASTQAMTDALRRSLAAHGHQAARVDLAVHGLCAGCREDETPCAGRRGRA